MRLYPVYLLFILMCGFNGFAQQDSVAFTVDSVMSDGVYVSYADFRMNNPVTKEQVNSNQDKGQLNFLEKTLQAEKFSYQKSDVLHTTESKKVWGFFQNNTLYVNYEGEFYRVPVFGSVSYLVATVLVRNSGFYDPRFGYSMGATYTREVREFVIDFYNGIVTELTMERAELLLSRDKALYDEFMKLSRHKRKEQLYRFIRRYNEMHPVYFLKAW